jgi:hypothetical protein
MARLHPLAWLAAIIGFVAQPLRAQAQPPIRTLTAPVASDSGLFVVITSVRPLRNGSVIINDMFRRRLLMFDSTMTTFRVLADTAMGAANKYPDTFASVIPWLGDSTLFVDRSAQAFVVIDGDGKFVRAMAAPKPADLVLLSISGGGAAIDPLGRLVYRVTRRRPAQLPDSGKTTIATYHDSAAIVRADFETRTIDTVATHASGVQKTITMSTGSGWATAIAFNPLPASDDWAMLPDGTIAIVRVQDYHIDWVAPDGSRTSTPKMPFDWKRVPEEEKVRILDSARTAAEDREARAAAASAAAVVTAGGGGAGGRGGGAGGGAGGRGGAGGGDAGPPAGGRAGGVVPFRIPFTTVEVADLPDYYPPIRAGSVKADPEGNVWILPTTSTIADGGLAFDVVNRNGEIIERVKLPPNRNLLALGYGGVVYMTNSSNGAYRIERARVIR